MINKITVAFLCFLTISASITAKAQQPKAPDADEKADAPFLVTSFNRLALDLKRPEYPKVAKDASVTGRVEIWIEVDKNGAVTKARPVSGPEQLREASVAAALQSKFKPFEFQGKIFKAAGPLAFYFPETQEKDHIDSIKMCLLSEWINSGLFGIPFLTESWIKEVDAIDPAIVKEVAESGAVKNGGQNALIALIDGVTARSEKRMTNEKLWYFQFGKKMGKLEFVILTDGSEVDLKARLSDIREHSKIMPSDFPYFAARDLKSLIEFADKKELTSEEIKKQLVDKASDIHQSLEGPVPRPE